MAMMYLKNSKLCLSCEIIFDSKTSCPMCGKDDYMPLTRWFKLIKSARELTVKKGGDKT